MKKVEFKKWLEDMKVMEIVTQMLLTLYQKEPQDRI
jgi:hypothetical protein